MRGECSAVPPIEIDECKLDEIFSRLDQCRFPGAAVGIAVQGKPVYRRGFGLANMEAALGLTTSTRMRIGSTTKHMTSLAYMLLCEDGAAAMDDTVGKYLPELHRLTHAVTMRQLMGHLSGLRDVFEISWQLSGTGHAVSSTDLLSHYRDIDSVNAAPGTVWSYNNGAYLILSAVIEKITGQALESVLRERIFEPIGMFDTLLRRRDSDFVPNSATLHTSKPTQRFEKAYLGLELAGEGGVVTTVDDMLRWLAHMDSPSIGSEATWKTLRTPQRLANGSETGYGLGLKMGRYRGADTLFHDGGVLGGNCNMLKVPAAGLDVVIILNRDDILGSNITARILDACLPDLESTKAKFDRPFVRGTFVSPKTGRVITLFRENETQMVSIDAYDWPFVYEEDGVLRPSPIWNHMQLGVVLEGNRVCPSAIRFDDFGNVDELVAVEPPQFVNWARIIGRYHSSTVGASAAVTAIDETLTLNTQGWFGAVTYKLEIVAGNIWRARSNSAIPWDAMLTFGEDGRSFLFTTMRTKALTFHRDG